jgi:hypothetical protein
MNPFEPPKIKPMDASSNVLAYAGFVICLLLALVGIATAGFGLVRILKTTPAMGILVDARGNPLPIEGYPQLWIGLALTFISAILGILSLPFILRKREDRILAMLHKPAQLGLHESIFHAEHDNLNTTNI